MFTIAALRIPLLTVGTMAAALSVTHGFLPPPHPGPTAIATIFHAMGKRCSTAPFSIPTISWRTGVCALPEGINKPIPEGLHNPKVTEMPGLASASGPRWFWNPMAMRAVAG